MKKNLGFFIAVDVIFLAVSVWFFMFSGLFKVDSETNRWFAMTYIFTVLCIAVFTPSTGFLSVKPTWEDKENEKVLQLFSGVLLGLAAYSAICYVGDTESFWAFLLIFLQLIFSFFLILAIEILLKGLLKLKKLFHSKLSRVY